jgi:four helix bundle protein
MTKFANRSSKCVLEGRIELGQVRHVKDLVVWQLAREPRIPIYGLVKKFPADERYALNAQMRRAAQSIGANIAERFARYSYRENSQFCRQSRGSAFEIRDRLVTALDAGPISGEAYEDAEALAQRVLQTLNGYIQSTRKRSVKARV